jgi:hypothetical protein
MSQINVDAVTKRFDSISLCCVHLENFYHSMKREENSRHIPNRDFYALQYMQVGES